MLEHLLKWQLQAAESSLDCAAASDSALARVGAHGDAPRWDQTLRSLPEADFERIVAGDCVDIELNMCAASKTALRHALMGLRPWRKGPFRFCEVGIDAEWRSDQKWRRLSGVCGELDGARVLDVGCGNGYYGWRMLGVGARLVIGIDHNPLCTAQHLAVQRYARDARNLVLPLALDSLGHAFGRFDAVFSMGVLTHSRHPAEHLRELRARLRGGGRLVLETLVLGSGRGELRPGGRYARMRNVWRLPGTDRLCAWIQAAGFTQVQLLDVSRTSVAEQRRTPWMPYQSLAESLNLSDSSRTLEGLPAPRRAIFIAKRT